MKPPYPLVAKSLLYRLINTGHQTLMG